MYLLVFDTGVILTAGNSIFYYDNIAVMLYVNFGVVINVRDTSFDEHRTSPSNTFIFFRLLSSTHNEDLSKRRNRGAVKKKNTRVVSKLQTPKSHLVGFKLMYLLACRLGNRNILQWYCPILEIPYFGIVLSSGMSGPEWRQELNTNYRQCLKNRFQRFSRRAIQFLELK